MSSVHPPTEVSFYTCDRHMWFGTTDSGIAATHRERNNCKVREQVGKVVWP